MLLNSWSIALTITSIAVLFVTLVASHTAVRVIRYWNRDSDSNRQINLENETWLTSTLMEYGLGFQILSLLLLVMAADSFSAMLAGAMCATGSFLANDYGVPGLTVKLISVFFYGFWIVLHRLDISSYRYPLVRIKYYYLLCLCPLLLADISFQSLYLFKLEPDIITSCCGVIFQEPSLGGLNLSAQMASQIATLTFFFSGIAILVLSCFLIKKGLHAKKNVRSILYAVLALSHLFFFPFGLWIITNFVSPYVYSMPHHRCPFCLLHSEYFFVGYPLFVFLGLGVFLGLSSSIAELVSQKIELSEATSRFQPLAMRMSVVLLILFLFLCTLFPTIYYLKGGE